ncbi:MAG: hypothetical protein ACPF9D_03195 [Owenweeksia sp.]
MQRIHIPKNLLLLTLPLSLLGILVILMQTPKVMSSSVLGPAITIDLLLSVPLIYFLLIRKTSVPNTTVIPVMILGLVLGSYFLPPESQSYLSLFKTWVLPLVEVSVVGYVIVKVRTAIRKYQSLKDSSPDFFTTVKNTCAEILPPKLVWPMATEIAVIYYGFIRWKKRALAENEFSYHRKSGTPVLMIAFILIIGIETVTLHSLLTKWSVIAAWILTGLSIYTALQVLGFARSLSQRPVAINKGHLILRFGILNEAEVPLKEIESVELSTKELPKDKLNSSLSPLATMEGHNVVLRFQNPQTLSGLYGLQKKVRTLTLHLDEPVDFKEALELK